MNKNNYNPLPLSNIFLNKPFIVGNIQPVDLLKNQVWVNDVDTSIAPVIGNYPNAVVGDILLNINPDMEIPELRFASWICVKLDDETIDFRGMEAIFPVPNQPNGLSIPYSKPLLVPYEEMSYERETVTKKSALKFMNMSNTFNDLTSYKLKDYINRMSTSIPGIQNDFNRIDVWVSDNQKAKFEQLLQNTGYNIPVNYVPQGASNSYYEFQLVKTEKQTVKIEEK